MYINNFKNALIVNKNEKIIKKLENINYPNDYAKLILYYLVYCMVFQGMDAFNIGNLLSAMFPIGELLKELKEFFTSKSSILSQLGYIEPLKSDYQSGTIKFTKKFMKTYLSDDPELSNFLPEPNVEHSDVIKPVDIKKKNLFYNKEEGEKIDILTDAFKNENLKELMGRLEDAGFSQGMTVLFHGYPGTGKTETALQLAKATGRSVMQVDFSQIRDMWVGNSEKNMKAVFESYYAYVEKTQDVPILLFNEADSVISKRITNIRGSVDQMNNTLQNILLQEMENFKGILIATTNLIDNIDNAFDRRFLYKVPFKKPDSSNRIKMWKSRNKWLKAKEARELAERYDFTGGQIENVTKKYVIDSALKGEKNDALVLLKYCEEEEFRSKGISSTGEFKGFG
jgi:SpoVK/Ycf46/Vps4 family AAA+-type ATPase